MGGKRRTDRRTDTPGGDTPTPQDEIGGGEIKPISYRPSREVLDALAAFRGKFDYPPDKTAVIERALRMYLRAHGFALPDKPGEAGD
jgi:hypothetical protein